MDIKIEVGNRLKDARKVLKLTQKEVAEKLNMRATHYARYENGKYEMSYSQIILVCKFLDISADYLFGLKEF